MSPLVMKVTPTGRPAAMNVSSSPIMIQPTVRTSMLEDLLVGLAQGPQPPQGVETLERQLYEVEDEPDHHECLDRPEGEVPRAPEDRLLSLVRLEEVGDHRVAEDQDRHQLD